MLKRLLLLLAAIPVTPTPTPTPAVRPYVIVLKGDVRMTLVRPPEVRGAKLILRVSNGTLMSVASVDVDEAATRIANAPPPPVRTPTRAAPMVRTPGGTFTIAGESSGDSYSGSSSSSRSRGGPVHVRGYTKSDGTYVAPHSRAAPGKK